MIETNIVNNKMQQITRFPHVYKDQRGRRTFFWIKASSGRTFFEERIFKGREGKFRQVDPERSKLFAAIAQGVSQLGLKEDTNLLYLGASHGYTVSFLADMLTKGHIYALDFAPRVVRDLVFICEAKENMAPILADANHPETYSDIVPLVDVVFMDISQRNQPEIFIKNCDAFLKQGGFGLLALKARSIDVTKKPKMIYKEVRAELERHYTIVDYRELDPYEEDHAFFVIKKR